MFGRSREGVPKPTNAAEAKAAVASRMAEDRRLDQGQQTLEQERETARQRKEMEVMEQELATEIMKVHDALQNPRVLKKFEEAGIDVSSPDAIADVAQEKLIEKEVFGNAKLPSDIKERISRAQEKAEKISLYARRILGGVLVSPALIAAGVMVSGGLQGRFTATDAVAVGLAAAAGGIGGWTLYKSEEKSWDAGWNKARELEDKERESRGKWDAVGGSE